MKKSIPSTIIRLLALTTLILSGSGIGTANAVLMNASYAFEDIVDSTPHIISFMLDGTIEGDIVIVESLLMAPELDGVAPDLGGAEMGLSSYTGGPARLSSTGDTMDFLFSTVGTSPTEGFTFCNGLVGICEVDGAFFGSSTAYGSGIEIGDDIFNPATWLLEPKSAPDKPVPEPAIAVLFTAGLLGIGLVRRRKDL